MATEDARAPDRAGSTRVPDFFVVGHPKSGTTAMHHMLVTHPQIHMPVKEARFFAPELRSRYRVVPSRLPDTLEGYLALFAGAGPEQIIGEASPSYLRSHEAAARIAAVAPEARIIAIFREPASFLRSFHLQSLHNHVETQKQFRRAIELEPLRREGKRISPLSQSPRTLLYSDHVRYVEQLRRFHSHFSPEQVLVLIYDDFRDDNETTVRTIQRFLGVDDTLPIGRSKTRPLPGIRSLTLHQLARGYDQIRVRRPGGQAKFARRRENPVRRAWAKMVYTQPPAVDQSLMLELRRRFKPEVLALSEYLGRDLVKLWGYDDLDGDPNSRSEG